MSYVPQDSLVQLRNLKVERLVIPFSIVGSATSTSVVATSDEPGFVFFATQGVDGITGALSANETATFGDSPDDGTGVFNVLIKLGEPVGKLCSARMSARNSLTAQAVKLGSSTGITTGTGGGKSLMLTCDTTVDLHGANTLTGVIEVDYAVSL